MSMSIMEILNSGFMVPCGRGVSSLGRLASRFSLELLRRKFKEIELWIVFLFGLLLFTLHLSQSLWLLVDG